MPGQAIVTIRDKSWQAYLANTPWEVTQGLLGATELPAGTGMLFDMGWEQPIVVTTQGMQFPLDIVFISESLVVVDLVQNLRPGVSLESRPARYFLEVNAGETEGIDLGDRVALEIFAPVAYGPADVMAMFTPVLFFALAGAFVLGLMRPVFESLLSPEEKPVLMPKTGSPEGEFPHLITEEGIEYLKKLQKQKEEELSPVEKVERNLLMYFWSCGEMGRVPDWWDIEDIVEPILGPGLRLGERRQKAREIVRSLQDRGYIVKTAGHVYKPLRAEAEEFLKEVTEEGTLMPKTRRRKAPTGEFQIRRDRYGAIVITRPDEPKKSVYLQFDVDQKLVLDLLTEKERKDLEEGWPVVIRDTEPRASVLEELWEAAAEEELEYLPRTGRPDVSREELKKLVDRWAEELKISPGTLAVVNIIMPELPHLVAHLKTEEDAVKLARKIYEETGLPTKAYLATHSGIVFWQSPNYPSRRRAGEGSPPRVQYLPKAEEGGEYTWTLWDPKTGEYMMRGGFSTVEKAKRDAARFAARRAREIGSWLPLVLWIHQIPAKEIEIGRLDETAVFKGKLEPEARGARYLPQSFRIEVSAFGPPKVITEGMPKLPEEAYKDWYFVKYIRDLCREAPVSEDEARRYWDLWKRKKEYEEKYKEQIEEEWEERKRRWLEEERGRSPKLLGPERKEEAPEELRYFADSKDHIEDSVNRNNLRSMLEEAFKEAIARVAEKKIGEIWR